MHLLVTRPSADAERTAQAAQARGHQVTLAPVLQFEIVDAPLGDGPYAALVMTSANAARAVEHHPRRARLCALPVFTVGSQTAAAARAAGFANIAAADGGLPALARLIAAKLPPGRLLYLAAEDRAGDLAAALAGHGFGVDTAIVYRMAPDPRLQENLRAAFAAPLDGVLHYSRRSAQVFLDGARDAGVFDAALKLTHYCLSREVAAPLLAAGARSVQIAAQPNEEGMMELL